MVSDEEMRSGNIVNLFLKFAFPTVVGVVIAGIQGIIDGFFIGNAIETQGLVGVTLVYPAYMVIVAIGVIIGIGASSFTALQFGKGNFSGALDTIHNIFSLCLLTRAVFTVVGLFFMKPRSASLEPAGLPVLLPVSTSGSSS